MLTLDIFELVLRFALIGMGLIAMVGWKRDGERLDKCLKKKENLEWELVLMTAKLRKLEIEMENRKKASELFEEVEK